MKMTPERIAEARKRCEGREKWTVDCMEGYCVAWDQGICTKNPEETCDWRTCPDAQQYQPYWVEGPRLVDLDDDGKVALERVSAEAIVNDHNDLPAALDDLDALLAVVEALRNEREARRRWCGAHAIATRGALSYPAQSPRPPGLQAWIDAEDTTDAALAALEEE